jgi:hypothetical protein
MKTSTSFTWNFVILKHFWIWVWNLCDLLVQTLKISGNKDIVWNSLKLFVHQEFSFENMDIQSTWKFLSWMFINRWAPIYLNDSSWSLVARWRWLFFVFHDWKNFWTSEEQRHSQDQYTTRSVVHVNVTPLAANGFSPLPVSCLNIWNLTHKFVILCVRLTFAVYRC